MPKNDGLLVEQEMIYALNERRIADLSPNMRTLMRNLYGVLDENYIVKAKKPDLSSKTDIIVVYNNIEKRISIKSGLAKILHGEQIQFLLRYLTSKGISKNTIDVICHFQYGDGTTDGSDPSNRKEYYDLEIELRDKIKEANEELNSDIDFVLDYMDRCIFKGSYRNMIPAEYVYIGNAEYGVLASRNQFIKHTYKRKFDYFDHLHIGPLLIRPDARYVGREIACEKKRHRVISYWPNLREDVEFMSKRYNW